MLFWRRLFFSSAAFTLTILLLWWFLVMRPLSRVPVPSTPNSLVVEGAKLHLAAVKTLLVLDWRQITPRDSHHHQDIPMAYSKFFSSVRAPPCLYQLLREKLTSTTRLHSLSCHRLLCGAKEVAASVQNEFDGSSWTLNTDSGLLPTYLFLTLYYWPVNGPTSWLVLG